jgi:UDP-2,3-diacylglucosamine pyrophosphatase LpxH
VKTFYKTIVISDLHLGIKDSKAKEVVRFLKYHPCEKLILNGDIIDGWQLKRSATWKKKHTRFFKYLMKQLNKEKTEIIYLRGNHDDFLDEILPFRFGKLSIEREHIHESCGNRYYIVHGDIFDSITTNLRWIAKLGDIGYTLLLRINRIYNQYRMWRGLPYYSLSQVVKHKVKSAVSYIDNYEKELAELAKAKKCDGIICGHIHQPANKMIGDTHYLNSGDWVESLTALAETYYGEWKVIHYTEWLKGVTEMKEEEEDDDDSGYQWAANSYQ